jgi:hypothetical protein
MVWHLLASNPCHGRAAVPLTELMSNDLTARGLIDTLRVWLDRMAAFYPSDLPRFKGHARAQGGAS